MCHGKREADVCSREGHVTLSHRWGFAQQQQQQQESEGKATYLGTALHQ